MKKMILILLLICIKFSYGQTNYHAKNIFYSKCKDYFTLYKEASDIVGGGYYIVGEYKDSFSIGNLSINSTHNKSFETSIFLAKFNSNDSVLWLKNIAEYFSNYYQYPSVTIDKKGNILMPFNYNDSIIILGVKYLSTSHFGNAILIKLDSLGNYKWNLAITGSYGENIGSNKIGVDSSNSIYLSGGFGGYTGSPPPLAYADFGGVTLATQGANGFIAKYNENGNLIWVRQGGSYNLPDGFNGVSCNLNESVYALMSISPSNFVYFDSLNLYPYPANAMSVSALVKYSSSGKFQWAKSVKTPNFPDIVSNKDFTILLNQNIVVLGSYNSISSVLIEGYSTLPANISGTAGTTDKLSYLICYDSSGNVIWAKNPHQLIGTTEQPVNIVSSKINSDFYFVSYFDASAIISGNDTVYGTGYQNVLIECMDSMGNKKWHKIIKGFPGANARDIAINDNNEIIIVGNTSSSTLQCDAKKVNISSAPAMYILKLSQGDINWNDTLNGFEDVIKSNEQLVVYPNPCGEKLLVTGNLLLVNTIEVMDVLGRVVFQQINKSSTQQLQIDVSTLPSGIYFIKTTNVNGNQLNGKFVKQ